VLFGMSECGSANVGKPVWKGGFGHGAIIVGGRQVRSRSCRP
jgi:hypothetical protein